MAKNGSGIPGLETLLPAFYTGAVKEHGHSPIFVAQMAAENPARHFGLYPAQRRDCGRRGRRHRGVFSAGTSI